MDPPAQPPSRKAASDSLGVYPIVSGPSLHLVVVKTQTKGSSHCNICCEDFKTTPSALEFTEKSESGREEKASLDIA